MITPNEQTRGEMLQFPSGDRVKPSVPPRKPPPKTPRVATAPVPPNDEEIKRVFTYVKDNVPASLCIGVRILENREAIGAAYLCAQEFCDWCMEELKKPAQKPKKKAKK